MITQEECLEIFFNTHIPKNNSVNRYILRFMLRLNTLAKKKGYSLFNPFEYFYGDNIYKAEYILSTIEENSKRIENEKRQK